MKKERWDNRMSLWTRLIYGTPDMETWYQQNPTHQDTIRYYTAVTYKNDLPARYDTYKKSKEYLNTCFPKRILPEMTYEQIIAIIEGLNTFRPFFSEVFLSPANLKYPLNFRRNFFDKYYQKRYTFEAYKEDVEMGYKSNLNDAINLFYYWEDETRTILFSEYADFHSYNTGFGSLILPIFFNPKTFRDYALLCSYFSKFIKEAREKKEEETRQAVLKIKRKKEYELRECQIKLLNNLKNDLQLAQDEATKQMTQVAKEDTEIAERLNKENNNSFLQALNQVVKEATEEGYDIETAKFY